MKTKIYNLIILDESGSMTRVAQSTIDGCNETLSSIRAAQEKYSVTQEHLVSIYVFQGGASVPSRYLFKNTPIEHVRDITREDYRPHGMTPLYDAIGSTLTDLKVVTRNEKMAVANVTVITDGMENDSTSYTLAKVSKMIDALKELGWSFNFIGANIDVNGVAADLKIDNAMEFDHTEVGTTEMFKRERRSRARWYDRVEDIRFSLMADENAPCDVEVMRKQMKNAAKDYFAEDNE